MSNEEILNLWDCNKLTCGEVIEVARADERARVVREIGNECSDKDLNENIDWCIQTLSLFHITVLDKKRLCETLESQKAMIVMHDSKIRAESIQDFAEWYFTKYFKASAEDINNILVEYEKEKKHE